VAPNLYTKIIVLGLVKIIAQHYPTAAVKRTTGATMKKIVAPLLLVGLVTLAGCNTMEGVGKDVERGGEKVQDAAKDAKR
jgi:predicted small secreted protein